MLAGYTGLKKTSFPKKYTRNMYAEKYNLSTIGDLIADDTLEQSFISKLDVLDAVSVKYISYGSTATGSMLVEIEELCKQNVSLKKENDRLTKEYHEMEERLQEYEYKNKLSLTVFEKPLDDYKFTIRTLKRFKRIGCLTVGDLVKMNRKEVAKNYYLGIRIWIFITYSFKFHT